MFGELCVTGNILLSQPEFTWNIYFKSCFSVAPVCIPLGTVWWAKPLVLGHGAQPERRPPPHALHADGEAGATPFLKWRASGSRFCMWQSSSLAAIYWKSALDTRVCKRINKNNNNNNNNRKIEKKQINNKNEREKSWFFRRCTHPPTHVYLRLRERFLDQCCFSLLWVWANYQVRVTVTNHT